MLPARTRGTIRIDSQIRWIDFDFDIVVNFRRHKNGGKGGVPPPAAVKGRLADQPMHARLGPQPTKGVFPFKLNGRTFEPRHFTCRSFNQRRFEPLVFAPTEVHPQQHLCPVLGLGAP